MTHLYLGLGLACANIFYAWVMQRPIENAVERSWFQGFAIWLCYMASPS